MASVAAFAVLLIFLVLIFSVVRTSVFGHVEPEKHVYFEIVFLLLLAVLAEAAVFYLKQQNVIVLMLLGIVMGPSFISIVWAFGHSIGIPLPASPPVIIREEGVLDVFAQLGAIILLFKVGLHSKVERIFSKENLLVAMGGVIFPFAAGYAYASYAGGSFAFSMFVGAALTATSVGVTVALLREMGLLKERFAEVIIGAAVLDDILGLLVLSLVVNVTAAGGADALSSAAVTFVTALVFILGAMLAGRYFTRYFDSKDMSSRRFLLSIAFMLFFAYVAEIIGLSAIVGAFLAGIVLNRSRHHGEIENKSESLELFFMPIFFISLGMMVDVGSLAVFAVPILLITVIAILTKVIGCGGTALLSGLGRKESLLVGIGMVPRGEVALIIGAIGLSKGVLDASGYSIISMMALLTAFVAPMALARFLKK